jgi:hypothetical protein
VRVTTAHKILIASAIVFFAGYGLWELRHYGNSGERSALIASVLAIAGAGGLAIYLRAFLRSLKS